MEDIDVEPSNSKSGKLKHHSSDVDDAGPSHNNRFSQNIQDRNWSTPERSDQTVTNSSVRGNLEGSPVIVKRKYNRASNYRNTDNEASNRLNKLSHQTQLDMLGIRPKASERDQAKDHRKDAINRFMESTSKPAENMSQRSMVSWSGAPSMFEQSGSSASSSTETQGFKQERVKVDNPVSESDELLSESQQMLLPDDDAGADDVNADDKETLEDVSDEDLFSTRVYTNSQEF